MPQTHNSRRTTQLLNPFPWRDEWVAVQGFELTGEPRLNDHGTPGFARKFDRLTSPELDDQLDG